MTDEQQFRDELLQTAAKMPQQMIVVIWVGIFGFVQLSLASELQAQVGGFEQMIKIAYAGISGLMPVYVLYPYFDNGTRYLDDRRGKALAIVSGVAMAASVGWMLWEVLTV